MNPNSLAHHLASRGSGVPAGNPSGTLSTNQLDYKTYILYVAPRNAVSQEAMRLAVSLSTDMEIKDATSIPQRARPAWLNGVPVLLCVNENKIYKGSGALQKIKDLTSNEILGTASQSAFSIGFQNDTLNPAGSGFAIEEPTIDDERRYSSSGKVTMNDLDRFNQLR